MLSDYNYLMLETLVTYILSYLMLSEIKHLNLLFWQFYNFNPESSLHFDGIQCLFLLL